MQYSFKTKRLILQCRKIFLIKTQNFYIEKVLYVKQPKTVNLCNDFSGYSKNCNNIYTLSSFANNNYHHQEAVDRSTDTVYFSLSYQLTHIFQNHNTLYLFYYFFSLVTISIYDFGVSTIGRLLYDEGFVIYIQNLYAANLLHVCEK